MQIGEVKILKQ